MSGAAFEVLIEDQVQGIRLGLAVHHKEARAVSWIGDLEGASVRPRDLMMGACRFSWEGRSYAVVNVIWGLVCAAPQKMICG